MTAPPVVITPPNLGNDDNGDPIATTFADWQEFHDQVLSQWFTQDSDKTDAWCPGWRLHPFAAASVESLWRAWEVASIDPGAAMATYIAHQLIPIMRELLDGNTFAGCKPSLHRPTTVHLPAG